MNLLGYVRTIKRLCMDGGGASFENIRLLAHLEYQLEREYRIELEDIDADDAEAKNE